MIDLNSLAVFAKVVEANSFSEAARRLNMPISTVSRKISDLEDQLGVRLLERSTRNLRLTDFGSELLEHARRSVELGETVHSLISNQRSTVTGVLRLSCPPSISDTLLAPLVSAFQAKHPEVRIQILITERQVDHIADSIDLALTVTSVIRDSSMTVRRILTFRHQLVASPAYLANYPPPVTPQELLQHRLLAFSFSRPEETWRFAHENGVDKESLTFQPYYSINDYAGLVPALLEGAGIGELTPLVRPDLLRDGKLVEIMPQWRFRTYDLSIMHLGNRHMPRPVRVFKEFAIDMLPRLFPDLPGL